jgi:hypothetical protein
MFGDAVCADAASGKCDLLPEAQAWMRSTNEEMAGGHCFGFAVAASLLFRRKVDAASLGATNIAGLSIDSNERLQRLIAYDWALQLLDSVQSAKVTGSPNKILNTLIHVLTPHSTETYTIAVWKRDGTGGHAVTPYAVENRGNGKFDVLIYDNNYPRVAEAISFDTKADTWAYDAAGSSGEPTYTGDAGTNNIRVFPTSPGLGTQPCPFCRPRRLRGLPVGSTRPPSGTTASAGAASPNTEEIYLDGSDTNHADLLVTDNAGHRVGYVHGKLVDDLPGALVERLLSNQDWKENTAPLFVVPATTGYTITIDGQTLTHTDTETVGVIGPSYDVSVDNIPMKPGERDTLVVEPQATSLSYTSSRAESPNLEVGVSDHGADYAFELDGVSDQPGSTIELALPTNDHGLTMHNVGSAGTSEVNFKLTRYTEQGTQSFSHKAIALPAQATATLQFGSWTNPNGGIALVTTHDGQRTTQTLTNQTTGP